MASVADDVAVMIGRDLYREALAVVAEAGAHPVDAPSWDRLTDIERDAWIEQDAARLAALVVPAIAERLAQAIDAWRDRIQAAQTKTSGAVPDSIVQVLAGYTHAATIVREAGGSGGNDLRPEA